MSEFYRQRRQVSFAKKRRGPTSICLLVSQGTSRSNHGNVAVLARSKYGRSLAPGAMADGFASTAPP